MCMLGEMAYRAPTGKRMDAIPHVCVLWLGLVVVVEVIFARVLPATTHVFFCLLLEGLQVAIRLVQVTFQFANDVQLLGDLKHERAYVSGALIGKPSEALFIKRL